MLSPEVSSHLSKLEKGRTMSNATETERQLITLHKQYSEAYLTRNKSSLDGILADDWMLINGFIDCGEVVDKARQLKDLEDGTLRVEAIDDSEVKCRVYGDAAVVTGCRRSIASYKNLDVSDLTRFSQFYVRQEGKWRCVSTQVSRIVRRR
jgi:hypothetical protein